MTKIFDCFTFFGEYDLLEIRFNVLDKYVDKFVIVEGIETFSGLPKPLYWVDRNIKRFKKWEDKVIYHVVSELTNQDVIDQINERNYIDTIPFKMAFYQKEHIRVVLNELKLKDDDVIYYGDADEIWKPQDTDDKPHKLRQLAYSYYLNNRSEEDWRGTVVTKWKNVKCLNDLRANPVEEDIFQDGGWHFTNLLIDGKIDAVSNKIKSYDHQEINIQWVHNGLSQRITDNVDFLGRGYKCWVDESQLPEYILNNREKWKERGIWK